MENRIVIGLIGRKGSGKGEATKIILEKGFEDIEMGAILYDLARQSGIEVNYDNIKKFMIDIRASRGQNVVAEETIKKVAASKSQKIAIVGIRSPSEVAYFKENIENFTTIAITADDKTRFERMKARGAPEDPKTMDDFLSYKNGPEEKVHIEDAINEADYMLSNSGSIEDLKEDMDYTISIIENKQASA